MRRFSVFKEDGLEKLSFEYVPSRLPHREQYVDNLIKFLRIAVDQPGVLSERILITGQSGSGKTATARVVGEKLEKIAKNRGLDLIYAHVNCRTTSGKFGLVQNIIRQVAPSLPLRGYGPVELLHALWDHLNEHNKLLLLTLDEIDYYIRTTGEDIVYELTRLTDAVTNVPQRINCSLRREKEAIYLPFEEVESAYRVVCEEYQRKPAGRVLLHAFIKNLEAAGIIILGEKLELGLDGVKAEILEKFLMDLFGRI